MPRCRGAVRAGDGHDEHAEAEDPRRGPVLIVVAASSACRLLSSSAITARPRSSSSVIAAPRSIHGPRSSTSALGDYRAVGLEEEIEEAAARVVQNGAIVSVDSLGGGRADWYFRFINEGVEQLSPSARSSYADRAEPVLLPARERLGVEIRYASDAVSSSRTTPVSASS